MFQSWQFQLRAAKDAGPHGGRAKADLATAGLSGQVCRMLAAGNTKDALACLESQDETAAGPDLDTLRDVAARLDTASRLSRRGMFPDALEHLSAARTIRPDLDFVAKQEEATRQTQQRFASLADSLHVHLRQEQWRDAVPVAEQMLQLAPESSLAKEAKKRGSAIVDRTERDRTRNELAMTQPYAGTKAPKSSSISAPNMNRFVLWVDAVGGYLVCLDSQIDIGQATPNNHVHLPIIADISRRHARLRRDGESYLLEPMGEVKVNGRTRRETTMLSDNDTLEMGAVRLRFRQPHPLSASARLDIESRHRTQPTADSVLLFAESCVLGPGQDSHVICRDLERDVVLFKQGEGLACRSSEPFEVDGREVDGRCRLEPDSRVSGDEFSMSLEPL